MCQWTARKSLLVCNHHIGRVGRFFLFLTVPGWEGLVDVLKICFVYSFLSIFCYYGIFWFCVLFVLGISSCNFNFFFHSLKELKVWTDQKFLRGKNLFSFVLCNKMS